MSMPALAPSEMETQKRVRAEQGHTVTCALEGSLWLLYEEKTLGTDEEAGGRLRRTS